MTKGVESAGVFRDQTKKANLAHNVPNTVVVKTDLLSPYPPLEAGAFLLMN
jgi:hypothetical protein